MKIQVIADLKMTLRFEKKKLTAALRAAGTEVANAAEALLLGGSGQYFGASSGSPPKSVSGNLARHLTSKVITEKNAIVAVVSDDAQALSDGAPYAIFLEAGTQRPAPTSSKRQHRKRNMLGDAGGVAPHPFISLAYQAKAASIDERIKRAVLEDIKFEKEN